eukprot:12717271-Ditylum_brightwellii.AAC.1
MNKGVFMTGTFDEYNTGEPLSAISLSSLPRTLPHDYEEGSPFFTTVRPLLHNHAAEFSEG